MAIVDPPYNLRKSRFIYVGDAVLDPFADSDTTLKAAKELGINHIGYEITESYKDVIHAKLNSALPIL